VYAIDVGKGLLHWKLRTDPRVIVLEETNARFVESLPGPVQLVVCDASFISLKILLPIMRAWFYPLSSFTNEEKMKEERKDVITLIKPQFEAGKKEVARGKGVVRDADIHHKVLIDVLTFAQSAGLVVRGLVRSPVLGPKGNTEFLAWLEPGQETHADLEDLVTEALRAAGE
jgi:23S rRNA (cytidine1920-2'-O)/16S rRNA (cytidine1409-2'-O)-methyltransferase